MIPLYTRPTKILLLDDNINCLKNISLGLPQDDFSHFLFSSPERALELVNNVKKAVKPLKFFSTVESQKLDIPCVELDLEGIYSACYDEKRFDDISVMIVDYNMPGMTGLEFFQKIKCNNVQRILLTGEADENIAVEAFNKKLIDKFLRKQDINIDQKLTEAILEARKIYFLKLSQSMIELIDEKTEYTSALKEKAFEEYFMKVIKEYKIVEFYSLDTVGSYILINREGEVLTLFTQNEDQALSYFLEIDGLGQEYFSDAEKIYIKNRKKIFCYKVLNGEKLPDPSKWASYFLPSVEILGENTFYCALKKGFPLRSSDKVLSFADYYKKH